MERCAAVTGAEIKPSFWSPVVKCRQQMDQTTAMEQGRGEEKERGSRGAREISEMLQCSADS